MAQSARRVLFVLLGLFIASTFCLLTASSPTPSQAALLSPNDLKIHGYLEQRVSFNTQDPPDVPGDNRWETSMLRTSLYLESDLRINSNISIKNILRFDQEILTDYGKDLRNNPDAGLFAPVRPMPDFHDFYSDAQDNVRELYADINITDNIFLRLGRQQVAWGETDFFQALDLVNGFDFSWRAFLEPENSRLRKPLSMANLQIEMDELGGSLQLLYIPGDVVGNDPEQFITNFDFRGFRWAAQPLKTTDLFRLAPPNFNHPAASPGDGSYGIRWNGTTLLFGQTLDYSLAYLKTYNKFPMANPFFNPYKGSGPTFTPPGPGATPNFELIYPEIDVIGSAFNTYIPTIDMVLRGELAYTIDKPYNVGTDGGNALLALAGLTGPGAPFPASAGASTCPASSGVPGARAPLPGFCGIIEKDSAKIMLGLDTFSVDWVETYLYADRPGFLTFQLFDEWIVNYKESDDITDFFAFQAEQDEHSVRFTSILAWQYGNGTINPSLAWGHAVSYGGGFVIPAVQFKIGDHYRFKVEGDFFYEEGSTRVPGLNSRDTHLLAGFLDNNNQIQARFTYQF